VRVLRIFAVAASLGIPFLACEKPIPERREPTAIEKKLKARVNTDRAAGLGESMPPDVPIAFRHEPALAAQPALPKCDPAPLTALSALLLPGGCLGQSPETWARNQAFQADGTFVDTPSGRVPRRASLTVHRSGLLAPTVEALTRDLGEPRVEFERSEGRPHGDAHCGTPVPPNSRAIWFFSEGPGGLTARVFGNDRDAKTAFEVLRSPDSFSLEIEWPTRGVR
jgi:hypothetical protein